MTILIIEDELPAREKLRRLVEEYSMEHNGIEARVVAEAASVRDAVRLIPSANADVILMDIQLSDGVAFEIFEGCSVEAPVIFTTAFDEYLTEAFAHNGIDYLLKPIQREKLYRAFDKYAKLKHHFAHSQEASIDALLKHLQVRTVGSKEPINKVNKERIIVQKGREYVPLEAKEIAYCYTEHGIVSVMTHRSERFFTDKHVSDLEADLDPNMFFRLNRKYICHIQAIQSFKPESKGKIIVELIPKPDEIVLVSQEKASAFRAWMEK